MSRVIQALLMPVCIVCIQGLAYGGFLIELHGGGEIVVNDYWEEQGEIRYSRHGGFVGLPADEVKDIRPTERPVEEISRSYRTSGIVPSATLQQVAEPQPLIQDEEVEEAETLEKKEDRLSPESKEFKQRSAQLRYELSLNYSDGRREINNIENARRINDEKSEQEAMARLKILGEEQGGLTSEIEQLYGGTLPPWWFEIMEGR